MLLNEVRKRFLMYMEKRGHTVVSSAPLVPQEDATTLFTGSGMQPLLPYLLGQEHQQGTRLANSQKCFRANDLEEVGDNRHTTFFEMLGNWSLGDYFKQEQIPWCFSFLTDIEEGLGLDPNNLYVTVFAGDTKLGIPRDEESAELWKHLFEQCGVQAAIAHIGSEEDGDRRGIRPGERIFYYDALKNWWSRSGAPEAMPAGEPGGADTEVFFDFGAVHADPAYPGKPHPNSDSGQFLEIGNSVFMEYIRTKKGFESLPKKNIDFGGGLERMTAATEGVADVFRIDVFASCIQVLENASGLSYDERPEPFRKIADHVRSALFIIADGVVPSNTDRGYILRRLIREAVYRMQYDLGIADGSLTAVLPSFIEQYAAAYPEVSRADIPNVIRSEEERFRKTLRTGMKVFTNHIQAGVVTGNDIFVLQSTYGFPKELTMSLAEDRGVRVVSDGYDAAMQLHRQASRSAAVKKFKGGLADTGEQNVRYHTATHLLHQALRDVLGDHVEQRGSNITPARLRFDFTHEKKLTEEERSRTEDIVNGKIQEALPITWQDMSAEEAQQSGAIGLFQYEDTVRVYFIGEYSKEYCGGPHVENTGDLGTFRIMKDEAVSAGVRRIRAVLE